MATPTTPRKEHIRLSEAEPTRSLLTPPAQRATARILSPGSSSQLAKSSAAGLEVDPRLLGILTPRRLTASPVARIRDKDKTRKRLTAFYSLDDAVGLVKRSRHVVILSGAGISTSLNIPDFRSDDGFYSKLSSDIGITTPEEFFSVDFFKRESETFWKHVRPLLPRYARLANGSYRKLDTEEGNAGSEHCTPKYSKTHAFLALLQSQGKLLTNYTQNIDGLEQSAGVDSDRVIQCHGSWDTASCMTCRKTIAAKKYLPIIYQAGFPRCKCSPLEPLEKKGSKKRTSKKRKRLEYEGDSDRDSDDGTKTPAGLFKPDITFFGEAIPDLYVPRLESDKNQADLVIVLGTSLKVRPVKMMVTEFPPDIPQIWINRDRFSGYHSDMPGVQFDIELLGDCDIVIEELCRRAGFDLEPYLWHEKGARPTIKENANDPTTTYKSDLSREVATPSSKTAKTSKSDCLPTSSTASSSPGAARIADRAHSDVSSVAIPKLAPQHALGGRLPENKPVSSQQETVVRSNEDAPSEQSLKADSHRYLKTNSKTSSTVRVEADLDAHWRWRFHRTNARKQ